MEKRTKKHKAVAKVALISCPLWGTFDPPIGLAQLSSYLKKQGHWVEIFDLNIKVYLNQNEDQKDIWSWEQGDFWYCPEYVKRFFSDNSGFINHHIEQILKDNIGIVGFSVNAASLLFSLEFARRLKACDKGITIVFGGPIFLKKSFIKKILQDESVDVVIPGEGLIAFSELIESLRSGRALDSCTGLVFKRDNTIVNTRSTPLVNLDSLPFLDLTDLPLVDYDNGTHISLMTSRGCVRRCVFCSDAPCWPGYRAMCGKRIFQEVKFHKERYKNKLGHIDFMDLVFNGNMNSLIEFCDLMIEAKLDLNWTANMYIRPEMTRKVIKKMKAAKCEHIIIGIESGSEKVLRLMNKYYSMADADRIIKQMYDEGICVTANFMFGFPGETEEDFESTLDFLRRNTKFMGVYPSRTYCALEEFSYLEKHLKKFGIKPNPPNHLFWESVDGQNTYPVRLQRCRRFCKLAYELGAEVTAGVQTMVELDEWFNLGCYYESIKDYSNAITNFLNYFWENPENAKVRDKLLVFQKILSRLKIEKNIKNEFKKAINLIVSNKYPKKGEIRTDRPLSPAFVKLQIDKLNNEAEQFKKVEDNYSVVTSLMNKICKTKTNYRRLSEQQQRNLSSQFTQLMQKISALSLRQLNQYFSEAEFKAKEVWLRTFPVIIYLPLFGAREDFHYIFEPPEEILNGMDFEQFNKLAESKIDFLLSCAKRCIFKGGGSFSLDFEGEKTLNYFERMYPALEKELFTNGVNFSKEIINKLLSYKSAYIINFALHAANRKSHNKISNKDNFNEIMENLKYLSEVRKRSKNIVLNIIYTATALNIVDLPDVIGLAAEFGVDMVLVDYNCIYTPEQKDISCFFRQDIANNILDRAQALAKYHNLAVQLPPKFNQNCYLESSICRKPWNQLMINCDGKVFPCEHFQIWNIEFDDDNLSLQQIWDREEYKSMRFCFEKLGYSECSKFCYYVNPGRVNSLRSHIFNAKHFGFKDNQNLHENLSLDLDKDVMEGAVVLAECVFSYQDFASAERIIKDIAGKLEYPSIALRLLAGVYREKAERADSTFEREWFLKLAQQEVEKSLASWSLDSYTHAEAARIYSHLGHYDWAKEAIRKAISLAPQEESFRLLEQELANNFNKIKL